MTISCLSVFGEVSSTGKSLGRFLPTSFCLVDCLSILTSKISKIIHVTSRALLSLNSLTMASQATKQLKESWRKTVSRGIKALRVISFYPSDFIYSHRHTYSCFCLSVALHSERPAHLRPNMHPSEEMLGCFQQHYNTSSPLVISVALQETLGWDLKEHKCFTVSCSPETHVLRLRVSAVPQRCLTLLAWRQGKNYRWLPQKLSQAKAGRQHGVLQNFTCKVFWPPTVYGSTSSIWLLCVRLELELVLLWLTASIWHKVQLQN